MKANIEKVKKEVVTYVDYVEEDQINLSLSREEFEIILLSVGALSINDLEGQYQDYTSLELEKITYKQDASNIELCKIQDSVYRTLYELFDDLKKAK